MTNDSGLTYNQDSVMMAPMMKKQQTISGELRAAISAADKSMGQIARETGIDLATISRFMHGKGGLSTDGLDAIGKCLGLRLVADKPNAKKGRM